jgi:hemerythrin-like domain-containing protein
MLQAGQPVEPSLFLEIVEFMRMFADKCHHGKEEVHLFSVLVQKGVPVTGCPIGALTHEHQQGRALVSGLAEAAQAYARGDGVAIASLVETLHGITELYPNHIWKEDYLLFPMTNKVLGADDHRDLMEKFIQADATTGHDTPRRFEDMALELESLVSQLQRTLH